MTKISSAFGEIRKIDNTISAIRSKNSLFKNINYININLATNTIKSHKIKSIDLSISTSNLPNQSPQILKHIFDTRESFVVLRHNNLFQSIKAKKNFTIA